MILPMRTDLLHRRKVSPLWTWIYRSRPMSALFRCLPSAWREKLSRGAADRLTRDLGFARTARWNQVARADDGVSASAHPFVADFGPQAGVNVIAFASGALGLGEAARRYSRALMDAGYPLVMHDVRPESVPGVRDPGLAAHEGAQLRHDVDLLFVNPDFLQQALAGIGPRPGSRPHRIACWFWELESLPDAWTDSIGLVDEFLVASSFVRDAVVKKTDKPVTLVPLPLLPSADSGLERSDFGLREDAFVFLSTFDFNSSFWRKNPLGVIAAFRAAFPSATERVQLLIKSSNGKGYPKLLAQLLDAAAEDQRIIIRDEVLEKQHLQSLHRCVDSFVSLHRAEGFGLAMAEAMALGKPVIATGWSGNMEFMTAHNSLLVPFTLLPIPPGHYPHAQGLRWAEPDLQQAARHMRQLVADPELAKTLGARAAHDVHSKMSAPAASLHLIDRLTAIKTGLEHA